MPPVALVACLALVAPPTTLLQEDDAKAPEAGLPAAGGPSDWVAAVREALAEPPTPTPETCRVHGRAVDAEGRGVPGLDVWISRESGSESWPFVAPQRPYWSAPRPLAESLAASARWWRRELVEPTRTVTDEAGRFVFDALATGRVIVHVGGEEWRERPVDYLEGVVSLAAGGDVEVQLEVQPLRQLAVDVRLPDGSAPMRAWIVVETPSSTSTSNWTPEATTVVVPVALDGGWVDVYAATEPLVAHNGEALGRFTSSRVAVSAAEMGSPLVLALHERRGVYGEISSRETWRFGIEVVPANVPPSFRAHDFTTRLQQSGRFVLDGRRYALVDVPPGRYTLRFGGGRDVVVDVGEVLALRDIHLPGNARGRELRVTVRDHAGRVVRGEYQLVEVSNGYVRGIKSLPSRPLPEGGDAVAWGESGEASAEHATQKLRISAAGCPGPIVVEVAPGRNDLDVQFPAPAFVVVRVAGLERLALLDELEVLIRPHESNDTGSGGVSLSTSVGARFGIDARGRGRFRPLHPGPALVEAWSNGPHGRQRLVVQRVDLPVGASELALEVPALSDLTLSVPALAPGATVWLEGADEVNAGTRLSAAVDGDRTAVFPRLVPGTYRVREDQVLERQAEGPILVQVPVEGGMVTLGGD